VSIVLNSPLTLGPFTDANGNSYTITIAAVSGGSSLQSDFSLTGSDESWLFW